MSEKKKQKILIVDDCTMNREILIDMLQNEFDIMEAIDGLQAIRIIKEYNTSIDLMILDIIMPEADGFEVLAVMNETHIINDVPVIMISAENEDSFIERAYEMGVTDYISRPFNIAVVRRRVTNALGLHAKHKKLLEIITEQVFEKEKNNNMMINILSHIVESRNGESGMHTLNIFSITNVLLNKLVEKTDKYKLSSRDMSLITTASSLHDIGKIGVPENILNKPGRFTPEEFAIMKTHTTIGASLLDEMSVYQDEPLVKTAREICRWHHERYDGKGYPDGLKGDEIPISAQIVSVADVYDALTSERCYKKAYSHEQAFNMILNGECGTFSPLLMECLKESHDDIIKELNSHSDENIQEKRLKTIIDELIQYEESDDIINPLIQIEKDREKLRFFSMKAEELQFDYDRRTSVVILSEWGAKLLGSKRTVLNLGGNDKCIMNYKSVRNFTALLRTLTPKNPEIDSSIILDTPEGQMYGTITALTLWENNNSHYTGVIGKISRLKKI
ncbi:MAG: response regulator [Ruminococcus sp.]|nr:response regulator [Ruminococcus sp.]